MAGVVLQFGVSRPSLCHHLHAQVDLKNTPTSVKASRRPRINLSRNPHGEARGPAASRNCGLHLRVLSGQAERSNSPPAPSSSSSLRFGALWMSTAHKQGGQQESSPSRTGPCAEPNGSVKDGSALDRMQPDFLRNAGVWGSCGVALSSAGAAIAAEVTKLPPAPPSQGPTEPTDYLLVVLSSAAFLGLAILTIGVIYLSVSDFLENRQRNEQTKKDAGKDDQKSSKRDTVRVGGPKGFGPPRVDKKTEKSK